MKTAEWEAFIVELESFADDPLGFVRWAFLWGEPGTSLQTEQGPDDWQREQLEELAQGLRTDRHAPKRFATASGHGIGKSTEVAWLTIWGLMTRGNTRGVVTANTDTQLRTKTWVELSKWFHLLLPPLRELFKLEATSIHAADKASERTWRIDAIPWSERNAEAFAGLHNAGGRLLLVFDEASAIADSIWETAEGATTDADTEVLWFAFGNPTRATGRFREIITGRFRHLWSHRRIDSRSVKRSNKALIQEWIEAYGEDSDFIRVRVKGEFPNASSTQLIPTDLVQAARKRSPNYVSTDPMVWGLDVARFGDDASVLAGRRGRDANFPWMRHRKMDTMELAARVHAHISPWGRPDAIFVDTSGGLGAGPADRLRQMEPTWPVFDVNFGVPSAPVLLSNNTTMAVANLSAAMWVRMREWLAYGAIPDSDELESDLTGREYGFNGDQAIQLERKDDMKKRGLASPDNGDALALTFAWPVGPRVQRIDPHTGQMTPNAPGAHLEYDIHADIR
jgi:hypothetical protein